jgi:hypothetical protein
LKPIPMKSQQERKQLEAIKTKPYSYKGNLHTFSFCYFTITSTPSSLFMRFTKALIIFLLSFPPVSLKAPSPLLVLCDGTSVVAHQQVYKSLLYLIANFISQSQLITSQGQSK